MKNIKYVFPNALTIINLLLGCSAIIIALRGQNEYHAAWLIIMAAFFDLLDGMVAKSLDAVSEFGKQLDSLADMVSFGIAPAIIFFNWLIMVLTNLNQTFAIGSASIREYLILMCSLFFGAAAAIRLARFNISEKKDRRFNGLTSTAAAMIVASLWLILGSSDNDMVHKILFNQYVVLAILALLILLMLSNLKMLSLKFSGLGFTENFYPYLLIVLGVSLIVLFGINGIFFTMISYLLLSIATSIIRGLRKG